MSSPGFAACSDDTPRALRRAADRAWLGAAAGLLVLWLLLAPWPGLAGVTWAWGAKAMMIFVVARWCMRRGLPAHQPHARLGGANRITLGRLALITLLAGLLGEPVRDAVAVAWLVLALASVAALLDAVDGPVARRQGLASDFGARFDMESDALLVLVLSLWVWQLDQAGAWVLASGAMRYAFVVTAWRWPWLARPLPPRWRRKAVCVAQILILLLCVCPWVTPMAATGLAAAGLLALALSFALDLVWLARHRRRPSLSMEVRP